MNKLILILFYFSFGKSLLFNVDIKKTETDERYFLIFDKKPEIYYPRILKKTFIIDFYYTSILEECQNKIKKLKNGSSVKKCSSPINVITLKLPAQKESDFETLPFKDLFVIQIKQKGYKKIWEKRFPAIQNLHYIAPLKMSLYRAKKFEELIFTFPKKFKNILVHVSKSHFSIEIFGEGRPLFENNYETESKFIKQISYSTLVTDLTLSEGISIFDFRIKKKTSITYRFLNNLLKIQMKRG